MKKFRIFLAVLAGKAVKAFCRLVKKGGTAMPGRIALKICPDLLKCLSADVNSIAVTGTNGKTTACRMIEAALSAEGLDYFSNRSGANLIIGIVTEFMDNCTVTGRMKKHYAVIECDEAATKQVFAQMQPKAVLVTNLFNDQLDRFGTVKNTLENIRIGISGAPKATVCLNADEPLSASLADGFCGKVIYYGMSADAVSGNAAVPETEEALCVKCGEKYSYSYITYAHLGGYYCSKCGYSRPAPNYCVAEIKEMLSDSSRVTVSTPDGDLDVRINLPATYNIYNAAGALATVSAFGVSSKNAVSALDTFSCGFGRMEYFPLGSEGSRMVLVKNAAGCNQVIEFLCSRTEERNLVLCFNSRIADGTDLSWIELAEFERLSTLPTIKKVYISGERSSDLYDRIIKAGFSEDRVIKETDYNTLADMLSNEKINNFIMPTYTAMLEFRGTIVKRCGGKEFFEL